MLKNTKTLKHMNRYIKLSLYKSSKHVCIQNTSNIHKNKVKLVLIYYSWKPISKNIKLVCVCELEHINYLIFTNGSKHTKLWIPKSSWRSSIFKSTRSKPWSTSECNEWSWCSGSGITMWKASKLFCWSNHQLISWLMIWN